MGGIIYGQRSDIALQDQSQTPMTLTQGSQKEEAIESKENIVNIKKTSKKEL